MTEFSKKTFTQMVYTKLASISGLTVVLSQPTDESIFPCALINNPLTSISRSENGVPVEIRIQVSIEYWNATKYGCMDLSDSGDIKLRDMNLIRTNTTLDTYDEITRKYRYGANYEVIYDSIHDALITIK